MADHYQIIHKNPKRLIAYGCSHTFGEELTDHLSLNMSFDECNKLKKRCGINNFPQHIIKGKKVSKYMKDYGVSEMNKKFSYPNILSNLIGIESINNAQVGNSQSNIYWQLVDDFQNNNIDLNDLILIGITLPNRYIIMQQEEHNYLFTQGRTIMQAENSFPNEARGVTALYTDEKFVWEFYNYLWLIKIFAEENNLKLIMVPTSVLDVNVDHPDWNYRDIHQKIITYAKNVWIILKDSVMVTDQGLDNFFQDPNKPILAGWGHYPMYNHKAYAKHIYDRLKLFGNFIRV